MFKLNTGSQIESDETNDLSLLRLKTINVDLFYRNNQVYKKMQLFVDPKSRLFKLAMFNMVLLMSAMTMRQQ